jgi:hypothetical protein
MDVLVFMSGMLVVALLWCVDKTVGLPGRQD